MALKDTPIEAAQKAIDSIGLGYDVAMDIRLKYRKGESQDSLLIEIDGDCCQDVVLPGGIRIPNVSKSIKCDKGERMRFSSDVLTFQQMAEQFNQEISLSGKIPSGLFNAMFEFSGGWQKDAANTKTLAFDGWFITLYTVALAKQQMVLRDHVKQAVPSSWDPAALAQFIEKFGTHIIIGVKMGGKDVIYMKQLYSSNLQPAEVQKKLKEEADKRFLYENEQYSTDSEEAYGNAKFDSRETRLRFVDSTSSSSYSQENIQWYNKRRGGKDDKSTSHNNWLASVQLDPDVISMSFVPITSLLNGIPGSGFLSHAINLYLRYKPPIEDLHQFLEFQLPRQWAPVFSELSLGPQRKQQSNSSLQFKLLGPKLFVNTNMVDVGKRPVTGLRLYLEGKRSNRLAIHLQHLSSLPKIFPLEDDPHTDFEKRPCDNKYYEPVQWKYFSHVCTAPIESDDDFSIVTGAWFEVADSGFKKILFLRLRFSKISGSATMVKSPEWDGSPSATHKSGLISTLISTHFSIPIQKPPWKMLHELLLALVGYTGDLIIDEREHHETLGFSSSSNLPISDQCTFKLSPDISFIEPSERDVIERLISLGFYYRELDRFATKSRNLSWIRSTHDTPLSRTSELLKEKVKKPSVYRRAIANGIIEILSVYRSAVLQVEQNLLSDPTPILATVTQGLNKFDVLLPPLHELIVEIERDDIRGGQLLNLLHKRCHCGVPELQACIQRLLWHGHQVMYHQLASWMVYGILHDQHGEFFITRQEDQDVENESSRPDTFVKSTRKLPDDASLTDWHLGFHFCLDMLPEYIHMRVAESILFAGKAIRVLRNPSPAFRSQDAVFHQQIPKGSHGVQGFIGRFSFQKEPSMDTKLIEEELFPQSEADKIDAMLQELKESSEFHKRSFEYAVDSIRTIAASHLWQLVVIRADLNGHLKALKDYFLLAKGDFFQCFLEESRQLMRLPPRQSTAEADLMVPFQLAAIKTIGDEDKYFSRISLRMPSFGITLTSSQVDLPKMKVSIDGSLGTLSQGSASSELSLDGWDDISLEYSVDWPLQLFFTQEVLSKYRRVFQYLLRLKRAQMELEKSWASVMHQDHTDFAKHRKDRMKLSISQQRRQRSRPMWRVREHMAFLIRNLQFYIQVDVIESQWNVLQARVQDSHDFTELVDFHQEYLSALISQSFLDIGSVSRILDSIMKLCLQFCWSIEHHENSPNTVELEHITEEFNKKSNSLYTILRSSRLAGSQRAPFLRRFLLRLNFNSFFEATAKGVMNVVRSRPTLSISN